MTNRERALAVLRYQSYDRLPIVHFGYWGETLQKWVDEGHLEQEEIDGAGDGNPKETALSARLGFDFNWQTMFFADTWLRPPLERRVVADLPDGTRHVMDGDGVIYAEKPGAGSIPSHVDYLLKDRAAWEEHFKWRLQWSEDRVQSALDAAPVEAHRENPLGLHCGSLYGHIRTMLTFEGSCYLLADDEELFTEIVDTVGDLCYRAVQRVLESGRTFDFAHFWEDICFKNGPCISPKVFREKVGPHYKRITDLTRRHGLDICSLDCDGMIDALVPTWIENGVNTMFPIEVGTWDASIRPWRATYGRELRGIGGTNKNVFARDRKAVDVEVERLKPLVALGGYIPCPDHRLAPDAQWDLVRYYCERMREEFGG
jgi:uroporphyrinogen decarboxylase